MGLRKRFRRLGAWCPQPQSKIPLSKIPANFKALSMPMLVSILIAELIAFLIAPLTFSALLLPKSVAGPPFPASTIPNSGDELPLTNSQIKAAWPHLPTAQQIPDSDHPLTTSEPQQNETAFGLGSVDGGPSESVVYEIWLQLNNTTWIMVPVNYLATSNPPYPQYIQAHSTGFLGTDLSTTYVAGAFAAIIATLAGMAYLLHRKKQVTKVEGS